MALGSNSKGRQIFLFPLSFSWFFPGLVFAGYMYAVVAHNVFGDLTRFHGSSGGLKMVTSSMETGIKDEKVGQGFMTSLVIHFP